MCLARFRRYLPFERHGAHRGTVHASRLQWHGYKKGTLRVQAAQVPQVLDERNAA